MKKQLFIFLTFMCVFTHSIMRGSSEQTTEITQQSTPISFSEKGIDELITYLAKGKKVENLTALNDITSMEQIVYAVDEVALMRAVGTQVAEEKIEKFRKLEEKLVQFIATLKAAINLNVAPTGDIQEQQAQKMQEISEQIEALLISLFGCRQIIAMCTQENIVQTVEYALEVVKESEVDADTKKSFILKVAFADNHAENTEIQNLCREVFEQVAPPMHAYLI